MGPLPASNPEVPHLETGWMDTQSLSTSVSHSWIMTADVAEGIFVFFSGT